MSKNVLLCKQVKQYIILQIINIMTEGDEAEPPQNNTVYGYASMLETKHENSILQIDLTTATTQWKAVAGVDEIVEKAVNMVLIATKTSLYIKPLDVVSILLSDDKELQNLNSMYRGQNKPTNVLSFPYVDIRNNDQSLGYPRVIGDIAISYQRIEAEALEYAKSLSEHLSHMLVHGMLHLLQYDHRNINEAAIMEEIETECMHNLNYKDFEYEPIADND